MIRESAKSGELRSSAYIKSYTHIYIHIPYICICFPFNTFATISKNATRLVVQCFQQRRDHGKSLPGIVGQRTWNLLSVIFSSPFFDPGIKRSYPHIWSYYGKCGEGGNGRRRARRINWGEWTEAWRRQWMGKACCCCCASAWAWACSCSSSCNGEESSWRVREEGHGHSEQNRGGKGLRFTP